MQRSHNRPRGEQPDERVRATPAHAAPLPHLVTSWRHVLACRTSSSVFLCLRTPSTATISTLLSSGALAHRATPFPAPSVFGMYTHCTSGPDPPASIHPPWGPIEEPFATGRDLVAHRIGPRRRTCHAHRSRKHPGAEAPHPIEVLGRHARPMASVQAARCEWPGLARPEQSSGTCIQWDGCTRTESSCKDTNAHDMVGGPATTTLRRCHDTDYYAHWPPRGTERSASRVPRSQRGSINRTRLVPRWAAGQRSPTILPAPGATPRPRAHAGSALPDLVPVLVHDPDPVLELGPGHGLGHGPALRPRRRAVRLARDREDA